MLDLLDDYELTSTVRYLFQRLNHLNEISSSAFNEKWRNTVMKRKSDANEKKAEYNYLLVRSILITVFVKKTCHLNEVNILTF